jgi:hypothetical protein
VIRPRDIGDHTGPLYRAVFGDPSGAVRFVLLESPRS